jgi:multidrug efflux system outer membrane protein
VVSEIDLRLADSLAETARASYAEQRRLRMQDENALALLLGAPVPPEATEGGASGLDAVAPMAQLPAGLPSDLLGERPDIRAAEQQLIAANANIGAARAAFFPRVTLTTSIGTASSEFSNLFERGTKAWAFAPQLTVPIFDAGRNRAGLDSAKAGREIAVAQYEKSIQTAFREVADALAGRATLGEQLRALRAQSEAEAVRFRLSDLRYRNGIASALDLLDSQRSLYGAQQAAVQIQLAQLQNQVVLYKTLGGGWATR